MEPYNTFVNNIGVLAMDAENPTKKTGSLGRSGWETVTSATTYASRKAKGIWLGIKRFCNPQGMYRPIWSGTFVISCVLSVLLDPLFFYIPLIDEGKKCLGMDKNLRNAALILRSLTDINFLVHFICQICNAAQNKNKNHKMSWLSVIVDFLALLPIPQLLLVVAFYNIEVSQSSEYIKVLNVLLLGQYLPKVYRIFLSCKDFKAITRISVKDLFNFFLYILVSHVIGAFWYFLSIQREISCWRAACVNHSTDPARCMNAFYCGGPTITPRNITFLNEYCPLDTPDSASAPFDFGIFLDSLKNHNAEQINFGKKFFYSFWWGLRNISNFGTNLMTSTYVWENFFAVLISLTGFMLVLYLIGNVQTWQMESRKAQEIKLMVQKIKNLDVHRWISMNNLPDDMKIEILNALKQNMMENKDVDMQSIFYILPAASRKNIKRFLCMGALKKVPMLQNMDEKVLTTMCDFFKPVTYSDNSFPFRMGDPMDRMLFVIEGTMWTYSKTASEASSMVFEPLKKGQVYGEELLNWASSSFRDFPISPRHVKCQTKVVAFAITAKDLLAVVGKNRFLWNSWSKPEVGMEALAMSTIHGAMRRHLHYVHDCSKSTPTIDN